jgi:hypothetical protein
MATEYITDVVDPAELTGYVRELVDGDLPFASIFPTLQTDDIEYELTSADLTAAGEVARYRAWDTPARIGRRPGVSVIKGEIPPLAWGYRLNEKELVRFNQLRQGIRDASSAQVERGIYDDAARAARAVQNRLTLAHGDLLSDGILTLTDLGDPVAGSALTADFAVPAAHKNVAPAGATWDNHATAVPVTDLKTWETTYRSNNGGQNPDAWLISSEVMADLTQNDQLKSLGAGTSGVTPGILTDLQVTQILRAAGVNAPVVVALDVERPQLNSSTPARVVGVKAGMGATIYAPPPATSALVLSGAQQMANVDPGIIAYQVGGIDPAYVKTTAEGLAIPVLRDPNALFVAAV